MGPSALTAARSPLQGPNSITIMLAYSSIRFGVNAGAKRCWFSSKCLKPGLGTRQPRSSSRQLPRARHYATSTAGTDPHDTETAQQGGQSILTDHLNLYRLVQAYRDHGHYKANIDPLGSPVEPRSGNDASTKFETHGFSTADLDREFKLDSSILPHFEGQDAPSLKLRDIIDICERTYCGTYSVEYAHVENPAQRQWLRDRLEVPCPYSFSRDEKARILDGLLWGAGFERLLATKFPTEKRYGLDGVESLVPAVASLIDRSAEAHGVKHVVAGTCHRGRLALAGTVYGKPLEALFAEFLGRPGWGLLPGSCGDVKTHLGNESERITRNGRRVSVSMLANPSHLESIDPVAQGSAHAVQRLAGDKGQDSVLNLALHGDAAFTGQGVVYETLSLSRLPAYDVGGTVRLIVNNQIGFTATPTASRSTTYCSDLAKFLNVPIFHVNSDRVEDVVFVCQLAADWRATFKTDCVVDIVCYRRFGHNEMDQPRFTQPLLYENIGAHKSTLEIYTSQLLSEGSFTEGEIEAMKNAVWDKLNDKLELSKTYEPPLLENPKAWKELPNLKQLADETLPPAEISIDESTIDLICEKITGIPEGFNAHSNLKRILNSRRLATDMGNIDWTAGEALAFGSLALEGHHIRILGEDAQRGTFSQRHAVFHDQKTGETWTPLANLSADQAPFLVENSMLSEYGALGFEYGVTVADPSSLVVWEAQFGDFVNTAQVIVDNYMSGAETKWGDRSGIVLSLPHGFDGQGPEHSSARIERFLMLCNEEGNKWPEDLARQHQDCNIQVVYPTTPANYFHVLRRQMRRGFRKRKSPTP